MKHLPDAPGIYIFKDKKGAVIYIGKAGSLKKRIQSYFSRELSSKTQALVSKIADVEYRVTPSETQAEILEAVLIKEHQPQYNISLKDDKSFPFIKITKEEFPLVCVCRKKKTDDPDAAVYFGPYPDAKLLRQTVKFMRRIFGFRSCKKLPDKICLYGRIKLCPAPCVGKISRKEYSRIIYNITLFLKGKTEDLINKLTAEMQEKSKRLLYEEAVKLRDQINAMVAITKEGSQGVAVNQLEGLRNLLGLDKTPDRIEGFDISNISGKEACGSMVSFYKGSPDRANYRRFRIKTVERIDDYEMLAEVIRRRYSRLAQERLPLPELILIDGGRSHLGVAQKQLDLLGLDIPLVSIAKEEENIYTNRKSHALKFDAATPALNLIRYIRNEAHRFAQSYHHLLRRKKIFGK